MGGVAAAVVGGEAPRVSSGLKRVGSAVVLIPLFVGIVVAPAWVFTALLVLVSAVAAWELARMFARAGRPAHPAVAAAAAAVVTVSFAVPGAPGATLTVCVLALLAASLYGAGATLSLDPTMIGVLALVYVGWLLGYAVLLRHRPDGAALVLFLVGVTWVGESAAYVVGSLVGRHPLAPVISPRKTIEGGTAQVVGSVVGAALLAHWLVPEWTVTRAVAAGGVLGLTGQVGDLAESVMKRGLRVKDAGDLIPGHGGMLDRIDGLLVNAPVLFYFARWTGSAQ